MTSDLEVLEQARAWLAAGRRAALATVVRTWGSAPRREGSLLAVVDSGDFEGSVSGGCVESAVVDQASDLMATGGAELLRFGVSDEQAWEVGLACGGEVEIHLQALDPEGPSGESVARVLEERARGTAPVLGLQLEGPDRFVLLPFEKGGESGHDAGVDPALTAAALTALHDDRLVRIAVDDRSYALRPFNPPVRIILVGAVHVAQTLAPMIGMVGFEVIVVDPRPAWLSEQRFPGVERVRAWPQEALAEVAPDHRTAVVTLSHDPKLDDPALIAALNSPAFYVGALGSRRTHAKRLTRLEEAGISADACDRIHAPVGLDLGAREPAEIAVAVLAELIRALRRPASHG